MRLSPLLIVALFACGGSHPATPTPPPPPRPIAGLSELEGQWRAADPDGWTFDLSIKAGAFEQTISRGEQGPCKQKGTVQAFQDVFHQPFDPAQYGGATYGTPTDGTVLALVVTLAENACNPDYTGGQLITLASAYHGDDVTLRMGVGYGGAEETRQYKRAAPAAPAK